MTLRIGVDIGGTNCRIGVFDDLILLKDYRVEKNLSQTCRHVMPEHVNMEIVRLLGEELAFLLAEYPEVETIGIGFPGFIHPQTQIIAQSPNLVGLKNLHLAADLSEYLGKKYLGKKVMVENDALAAAYGEYCLLQPSVTSLIYIGLGTGVGGGLVLNGKPFTGENGVAMEFGHLIVEPNGRPCGCGNVGCLEQYASATGVSNSYFELTKQILNGFEMAKMAETGDQAAQTAFALAGSKLGQAVAHLQKIVDVSNLVIGGGLSGAWAHMQASFNAQLNQDLIPVLRGKIQVNISTANDTAGMLGAAMLATLTN